MLTPRMLIIDDDPALLLALTDMLKIKMDRILIETAESPQEAMERIGMADYDCILSDVNMSGNIGLQLFHTIRKLCPDTPTLLMTGHGDSLLEQDALQNGAFAFLNKPLDRNEVVACLERALQERREALRPGQRSII